MQTKKFEEFKNGKRMISRDAEGNLDYAEGEIGLDISKLSEWKDEDLDALGEWLEGQLVHYGPSAAYKAAKGDMKKLESESGRYLCKDGVFTLNPKWRTGEKSAKQLEAYEKKLQKALAKFKATVEREPTADELKLIKLTLS